MDHTILLEKPSLTIEDETFDLLANDDLRINWRPSNLVNSEPDVVYLNPFHHDGSNLLISRNLTPHRTGLTPGLTPRRQISHDLTPRRQVSQHLTPRHEPITEVTFETENTQYRKRRNAVGSKGDEK